MKTLNKIMKNIRNATLAGTLGAVLIGCGQDAGKFISKEYYCYGEDFDRYTHAVVLTLEMDCVRKEKNEDERREISFPEPQTCEQLEQRYGPFGVYFDGLPAEYNLK